MSRLFLVLYDYGTGGVWSYLRADSAEHIHAKFPMLKVFDEPPAWMSDAERVDIESKNTYDVENAESEDPKFFGHLLRSDPPNSPDSSS
jgi:hypothetical protein